jgi:hypothetical protein
MVFAQLTGRESLRETVLCLNAVPAHLYHLGLPHRLVKSNIAHANSRRHWKIFYDFAMILLAEAKVIYQTTPHDFNFDGCMYALDSTTIDLCFAKICPRKHRQTEINRCRVKRIDTTIEVKIMRCCLINYFRLCKKDHSEVVKDFPVPSIVCMGKNALNKSMRQSKMVQMSRNGIETQNSFTETLATSKLGEHHDFEKLLRC